MKTSKLLSLFLVNLIASFSSAEEIDLQNPVVRPHIINGVVAGSNEFPFLAALYYKTSSNSALNNFFCGGSLIAKNKILTAAHCVRNKKAEDIRVLVGRSKLSGTGGQTRDVAGISIHPYFRLSTFENDVAILTLSSDITNITPVSVVNDADLTSWQPGSTSGIIAGWGVTTESSDSASDNLMKASVPIKSDVVCEQTMSPLFKRSTMMCAGVLSSSDTVEDGVDTCFGDSGGPLLVLKNGAYKVAGITSFGVGGCAEAKTYGIYSRLGTLHSWATSNPPYRPNPISDARIEGSHRSRETLTCTPGSFTNADNIYTYYWYDQNDNFIAEGPTYVAQDQDVDKKVNCIIVAMNNGGTVYQYAESFIIYMNPLYPFDRFNPEISNRGYTCKKGKCRLFIETYDRDKRDNISSVTGTATFIEKCTSKNKKKCKKIKPKVSSVIFKKIGADTWEITTKFKKLGSYSLQINVTDTAGKSSSYIMAFRVVKVK